MVEKHKLANKKVAIVYKATGRYVVFWQEFYASCQQYFLPHTAKTYFLFTDDPQISQQHTENVQVTLVDTVAGVNDNKPSHAELSSIHQQLYNYGYTFFFIAGVRFEQEIDASLLSEIDNNDGLMVCAHPALYYHMEIDTLPYERNPKSLAYIPSGVSNKYYVSNAISGGATKAYLSMLKTIANSIHQDRHNQITAIHGDESYLNKYLLNKHPLILPPNYLYPQGTTRLGRQIRKNVKILLLDQNSCRFGGYDYLQGKTDKKVDLPTAIWQGIRGCIRHPYNYLRKLLFKLGF